MKRLKALIKKLFSHKFVRFLFAGGLNTLFSYICFVILINPAKAETAPVTDITLKGRYEFDTKISINAFIFLENV